MGSALTAQSPAEVERLQCALAAIGGGVSVLQEVLGAAAERWECAAAEAPTPQQPEERGRADEATGDEGGGRRRERSRARAERRRELQEGQERLEERLRKVEERMQSLEERLQGRLSPAAVGGCGEQRACGSEDSGARMGAIETRLSSLEISLQRALDSMFPRVDALLVQLETPERVECRSPSPCSAPSSSTAAATSGPSDADVSRLLESRLSGPPGPEFPPPPPYEELDSLLLSPSALLATLSPPHTFPLPLPPARSPLAISSPAPTTDASVTISASTVPDASQRRPVRPPPPPPAGAHGDPGATPSQGAEAGGGCGAGGEVLDAALLAAAREASASDVRVLLERGARADACDAHGRTALHWAATYGRDANISLLLGAGADVDPRSSRSLRGFTPLHEAALRGHASCVRLLAAAGADLESRDDAGWTPLHLAAIRGQEAAARALLAHGAQPSARNVWGKRPRDVARAPALRRLLAK